MELTKRWVISQPVGHPILYCRSNDIFIYNVLSIYFCVLSFLFPEHTPTFVVLSQSLFYGLSSPNNFDYAHNCTCLRMWCFLLNLCIVPTINVTLLIHIKFNILYVETYKAPLVGMAWSDTCFQYHKSPENYFLPSYHHSNTKFFPQKLWAEGLWADWGTIGKWWDFKLWGLMERSKAIGDDVLKWQVISATTPSLISRVTLMHQAPQPSTMVCLFTDTKHWN